MGKNSVIMIVISVVVTVSLAVIGLLLLIPQTVPVSETTEEYTGIKKSEYTYEPTKNIQEEPEIYQYVITTENVSEGKAAKTYVTGKTNPFALVGATETTNPTGTSTSDTGDTTDQTEKPKTPVSASDK